MWLTRCSVRSRPLASAAASAAPPLPPDVCSIDSRQRDQSKGPLTQESSVLYVGCVFWLVVFVLALAVGSAARAASTPLTVLWLLAVAAVLIAVDLQGASS